MKRFKALLLAGVLTLSMVLGACGSGSGSGGSGKAFGRNRRYAPAGDSRDGEELLRKDVRRHGAHGVDGHQSVEHGR